MDVVELLKQVLQWTPFSKPGLNTALLQAAKVGSTGCVRVLLSAGADVDYEDEVGDTAFVHAFRARHSEIMRVLRDAGATTEIAKMSVALATRDAGFVKLCVELDIPIENDDWNSASGEEVLILLRDLQIDPFCGTYGLHDFADSPFMYLVQEGKPDIVQLLFDRHPCIDKYGEEDLQIKMNQALWKAIRFKRLDNVKVIIENLHADIRAMDSKGRCALLIACENDETIAKYFLKEHNADPHSVDSKGLGCLHWAAHVGLASLCDELINRGVSVEREASLGATCLMVACSGSHTEVAKLFLEAGCDVNRGTPEGWTALHVATQASSPDLVHLLLEAGAEPNVASTALTHGDDAVLASTPLLISISLGSKEMLRHLLDYNAAMDQEGLVCTNPTVDIRKRTPLQHAVQCRAWDIVEVLMKAGCEVASIQEWLDAGKIPDNFIEGDKIEWLRRLAVNTRLPSLKTLARKAARAKFGNELKKMLDFLRPSTTVRRLLLLRDLFSDSSVEV